MISFVSPVGRSGDFNVWTFRTHVYGRLQLDFGDHSWGKLNSEKTTLACTCARFRRIQDSGNTAQQTELGGHTKDPYREKS